MRRIALIVGAIIVVIGTILIITLNTKTDYSTVVNVVNSRINANVDEEICIKTNKYINIDKNFDDSKIVFSSDSDSVTVEVLTGNIVCVNQGVANIKIFYRTDKGLVFNDKIEVLVSETQIMPLSIAFEHSSINITPNSVFENKCIIVGEHNQQIVFSTSNSNVATYNTITKKIEAHSEGNCIITVTAGSVSATCQVMVEQITFDFNLPDSVSVSSTKMIQYNLEINNQSIQKEIVLTYDSSIISATITNSFIMITRKANGNTTLTVGLKENSSISKTITITE